MTGLFGTTPGPWKAESDGGRGAWVKGAMGEWAALACGDTDISANAHARAIAQVPAMLALVEMAANRSPQWDIIGAARAIFEELEKVG